MKKTVSINIGSIIFHIEEDGYEKLKNYLDSISRYFSSFEDSHEIIADIESRIAEIFLEKLAGGRQTVTIEDVDELIATMGTTQDFEATIESESEPQKETKPEPQAVPIAAAEPTQSSSGKSNKRLYRDTRRKMLGGVAAGIAHYFGIDTLWIRLLMLGLLFNVFFIGLSGSTLVAYIILWIVLPGTPDLEEDRKVKKLFRDSDSKVLGGVASGLARYFGLDIAVIRVLFVIGVLVFGSGLILYLILWIITPEAKTITEKMQMQGEPVTLSNIEENVRKSLNVQDGEETPFVKILLFPFRAISMVLTAMGKMLGPLLKFLVDLVRIFFGVIVTLIGFAFMMTTFVALLALLGKGSWDNIVHFGDFPIELLQRSLDETAMISGFLVTFIPALGLTLIGISIIAQRSIVKRYVSWALLGIWLICLVVASISIPQFVHEFTSEGDYKVEQTFALNEATPTLKLNPVHDHNFNNVDLKLRGHSDSTYLLILNIESRGSSRINAENNARNVIYEVKEKDGNFYFDSDISFTDSAEYRFQHIKAYFYIPYGKTFLMDEDLADILNNTLYPAGYSKHEMEGNEWQFEESGLKCITCKEQDTTPDDESDDDNLSIQRGQATQDGKSISYPMEDFTSVNIAAYMNVSIRQSDEWSVTLKADDEDLLDEVYVNQIGSKLQVRFKEDSWEWWRDRHHSKISVHITCPDLESLELTGDTDGEITGFDNDHMTISLVGACDLLARISPEHLDVDITGASTLELAGTGEDLEADIVGGSKLEAFDFTTKTAEINAVGASKAEVMATENLDLTAVGVSKIRYRGTDQVDANEEGLSSIDRD